MSIEQPKDFKQASENLKSARERKGYTQTKLAEMLGRVLLERGLQEDVEYSLRQYQKLESGKFPKHKRVIVEILDELLGSNIYGQVYDQKVHINGSTTNNVPVDNASASNTKAFAKQGGQYKGEDYASLLRTMENISEDKIKSTDIISRLVTMLETHFGYDPRQAMPGGEGVVGVKENRPKAVD
jgi:transcriptional regulator with XRE-family HTH domain